MSIHSRRTFLAAATFTAAAAATARALPGSKLPRCNIGVQLYVLRDQLAKDFDGTLAKVAAIGITRVEFAGFYGRTSKQIRASLDHAGLKGTGAHCIEASMSDEELAKTLDFCAEAGIHYVVAAEPSIKNGASGDVFKHVELADWQWSAERFNKFAARAHAAGLEFAYHNHNIDFIRYGNEVGFDVMMRLTDPSLVIVEFDIGNAAASGIDPMPYFRKYASRIHLAHIKEWQRPFKPTTINAWPKFADFGKGDTNWAALLATLQKAGVREIFIEQDGTAGHHELATVRQAFDYLQTV